LDAGGWQAKRAKVRKTGARGAEARRVRAAITIRVGGATVQVESGFDADLLRAVISALSTESK
jgi:hypothetical protein